MSQISTIYDAMKTVIETLLPARNELADSLLLETNDELFLASGFAIHFGPGSNTFREVGCRFSVRRDVTVSLSNAVYGTHKDINQIEIAEKKLLEDHYLMVKEVSKNAVLDTVTIKRNYISDNGIERVFTDQKNFVLIETTFEFEYFENLL